MSGASLVPSGPVVAESGPAPLVFRLGTSGPPRTPWDFPSQDICGASAPGNARCLARVLEAGNGTATAQPAASTGLSPANLGSVYGFAPVYGARSQTIALVDAYDDPNISSDIASFDSQYGLPAPSLTKAYIESNAKGQPVVEKVPPGTNSGWDLEISLDVEWAHAVDPEAKLLLVEAYSASLADLLAAEQYAGANATYVSNSWGAGEFSGETAYDSDFAEAGAYYFAAAGDTGGAVEYPSSSPSVVSVGGTSLLFNSGGLAAETAWSGGGGGCSLYENANPSQSIGSLNCSGRRATPDLSLDADPDSGVAVYDTVPYQGSSGWWTVGGTSLSTVVIAAESDNTGTLMNASAVYGGKVDVRDVVSGSNGYPALEGYDLVTGVGSWANTPGTVTTLSSTGGNGEISLSWSPPTGGASVSGYNLWEGSSSGSVSLVESDITGSRYTVFPVVPGTVFYYEVQPINGLGVGPLSNEVSASATGAAPGVLAPKAELLANQSLTSLDDAYHLSMQSDGNLVEYSTGNAVVWATSTSGNPGAYLEMEADGNLVLFNSSDAALWSSGTSGSPGAYLSLADTGQLSVVSASGVPLWAGPGELVPGVSLAANQSLSSPSGAYHLVMQGDGNLVEYNSGATALWAASTNPNGSSAVMQGDGNFVVYSSSDAALWSSGTSGNPGAYLSLADTGQLSVNGRGDAILWIAPT